MVNDSHALVAPQAVALVLQKQLMSELWKQWETGTGSGLSMGMSCGWHMPGQAEFQSAGGGRVKNHAHGIHEDPSMCACMRVSEYCLSQES